MRRGKPQQEIYRPRVSGRLRRSEEEKNRVEEEERSEIRRTRKPEREFYVPRPVAEAREQSSPQYRDERGSLNGNYTYEEKRSRPYSNNRNQGENGGRYGKDQSEWRSNSPNHHYRMGSEPRGYPEWSRNRDTRSVESSRDNNPDKIPSKPPSGRRHSTIGNYNDQKNNMMKNLENLPPRLRKKFLEDYGLTENDVWDGNTSVFKPSPSGGYHSMDSYTVPHNTHYPSGYYTLPSRGRGRARFHKPEEMHVGGLRPGTPDRASMTHSPINSRPTTPTRQFNNSRVPSRAQTPQNTYEDSWGESSPQKGRVFERLDSTRFSEPRFLSDYRDRRNNESNRHDHRRGEDRSRRDHNRRGDRRKRGGRDRRNSSRDCSHHDSKESLVSEGSSRTISEDTTVQRQSIVEERKRLSEEVAEKLAERLDQTRDILDWNEEVELNHRLEQEVISDALTRSSSVTSLHEISSKPMLAGNSTTSNSKKKRKNGGRRSKQRSGSNYRDKTPTNERKDSSDNIFKVPPASDRSGHRRRNSSRDPSFDRFHNKSRGSSRDVSFDRQHSNITENWREEMIRSRQNSEKEEVSRSRRNSELEEHHNVGNKGGLLVLPSDPPQRPQFPELRNAAQKTLFDPKNPQKPILVKSPGARVAVPGFNENNEAPKIDAPEGTSRVIPTWYHETSDNFKSSHFPDFLRDIKRADQDLQNIMNSGMLLVNYDSVDNLRQFLKSALEYLLCKAIKFCQTENVEHHIWKILYYNIIEMTRNAILDNPDNKQQYKGFLLYLIDEGTKFFERLITILEDTYKFKVIDYIGNNSMIQHKAPGFTGLALISAQKIFMFLGDLSRYKEQVNDTQNYGKSRQWYIKSHEINPKNGKPYNQLAVLAVCAKRKLDAVYYYMRSLMSSNPVPSAKQSLISLFDENRKKYEQGEKRRREERLERQRQHMKQKESEENEPSSFLRRETWIHAEGGRRLHRTTKALQKDEQDSEEEDLAGLSSVDVNKRFVTSYLHVHGKLITKIGMESFQDAAIQMLKEFRTLLQHSPVSLPCNRFLQLLALNMFAIESTQLKFPQQSTNYRSEIQERALIVSLQMFNLILERCVSILQEHHNLFLKEQKSSPLDSLPHDANVLLPAIKVWCDWMLCHTGVWNPPPNTVDYKVGPAGDLWSRLGLLMNILIKMDADGSELFVDEAKEGFAPVRLPEDATLAGFTPLIFHDIKNSYAAVTVDAETAQLRLRISKLLFFGTVYLCGLEPPVLKLEIEDDKREYVSVVCIDQSGQESPRGDQTSLTRTDEVLIETFSGDEEEGYASDVAEWAGSGPQSSTGDVVQDLLYRKLELEKKNRNQELHQQRVMKILSQSVVSVHLEIRPKYLVPDTNCFIDHLESIQTVAKNHMYTLMVPIVVLSELEGLSKGTTPKTQKSLNPDHIQKVAGCARLALDFLKTRHSSVKCVTTKGRVLASTTFSTEDETTWDITIKNDDKILTTCLVLCKNHGKEQPSEPVEGPRRLYREVVLLTEDRNLRVKAHSRDVPVRSLPDFMRWAELGQG